MIIQFAACAKLGLACDTGFGATFVLCGRCREGVRAKVSQLIDSITFLLFYVCHHFGYRQLGYRQGDS